MEGAESEKGCKKRKLGFSLEDPYGMGVGVGVANRTTIRTIRTIRGAPRISATYLRYLSNIPNHLE